jgi:hypothetical protein
MVFQQRRGLAAASTTWRHLPGTLKWINLIMPAARPRETSSNSGFRKEEGSKKSRTI